MPRCSNAWSCTWKRHWGTADHESSTSWIHGDTTDHTHKGSKLQSFLICSIPLSQSSASRISSMAFMQGFSPALLSQLFFPLGSLCFPTSPPSTPQIPSSRCVLPFGYPFVLFPCFVSPLPNFPNNSYQTPRASLLLPHSCSRLLLRHWICVNPWGYHGNFAKASGGRSVAVIL